MKAKRGGPRPFAEVSEEYDDSLLAVLNAASLLASAVDTALSLGLVKESADALLKEKLAAYWLASIGKDR